MSETAPDIHDWIGRTEVERDVVTAAQVAGLAATFDRDEPAPRIGDAIPPAWHWLFFLPRTPQSGLGPDGHTKRGGFLPPLTQPRRMFAGGGMTFQGALRVGEEIRRESEITGIREKSGRSGELVFVTVRHRIFGDAGLAVEEEQNLVYREAAGVTRQPPPVMVEAREGDWRRTIHPDPVLLFRFSALTFVGHRIHYDFPYVTEVEGYPGLIVHGPLTALLLLELCRDQTGGRPLSAYSFQAKRPLFATGPFTLAGRLGANGGGCTLEAVDGDGALAMTGSVTFAGD